MVILGFGVPYFYISISLVAFTFLMFLLLYFKIYFDFKVKESNYRYTLGSMLRIMRNLSFLPFINIFISVQKYSMLTEETVFEYQDISSDKIKVPYIGSLSTFWVFVMVGLVLSETIFNYEQYITRYKSMLYARAHSRVEIAKVLMMTGLCYSHFYFHKDYPAIHLLICL